MKKLLPLIVFLLSSTVWAGKLNIKKELERPGVKLVVVEFFATWCKPCMEAVPKWKKLHEKYYSKGLRFIVIANDDQGKCANVNWNPDLVICDQASQIMNKYQVKSLPQAFLYSWQGDLLTQRAHVGRIESAIKRYFSEVQLKIRLDEIEVVGDKFAVSSNPEWLRDFITSEIRKRSKFDVVSTSASKIPRRRKKNCSTTFPANSELRIKLQGDDQGRRTLTLKLEKDGCVLASSLKNYSGKGFNEDLASLKKAAKDGIADLIKGIVKPKKPAAPKAGNNSNLRGGYTEGTDFSFEDESEKAILEIITKPKGAILTLNGEAVAEPSPANLELEPGSYEIKALKKGYLPAKKKYELGKNGGTAILKLNKYIGFLSLKSKPTGMTVELNGKEFGKTPLLNAEAPVGINQIRIFDPKGRYSHWEGKIKVLYQKNVAESFNLPGNYGGVKINAYFKAKKVRAKVSLEGKSGYTPFKKKLLIGDYSADLEYKGERKTVEFRVEKGRAISTAAKFLGAANQAAVTTGKPKLKSCKARKYYDNAKSKLGLNPKTWCGDIASRFKKVNSGNKYIYDGLLKGHWSKQNGDDVKWSTAKSYCKKLGSGWTLPDIYQLMSLISENKDSSQGYINPIFSDTDKKWFWSNTPRVGSASDSWYVLFSSAGVYNLDVSNSNRVRCFRPGP